ncbi:hypothetical protein A3E15_02240 [Candidatus Woesebacteria bacterium RIFCSPHIGHO2_12_FULL_42_9]|uniref:Uncharacterized protein n=3 Tax=Candidatus Woeseibacteriota TaxID=1752722 RepID=A0A1F8AXR1_9BACT|nr:MAG: Trigger factor [Candidatus Woesebacteria bacterium GW2011_GWA1_39_12]OGM06280.1 MAG: hypothetical protein A2129_02295 [Candidatus Woesebacteria bacterium GWC1_42_13]OGM56542.1 MAG: hypothetical protein A3E15_02240 [Candidatus Woesebacteria bacterium RIFCSPHIGHO2_12_FULL_42_9]
MTKSKKGIESVLAREADGTIQITFTIPFSIIKSEQEEALAHLAKEVEIPGFRKGNAPLEKARESISSASLIEHALSHILPKALGDALTKFKIKPLIYPKFELIKAKDGEDWQIRGVTCEMPEIKLGDYQKAIKGTLSASSIWTPNKGKGEAPKEKSKEEKEQEAIKTLLALSEITIPKPLVDEEVDARLSGLLERTERLGLSLEKYLASIGKNPETLRSEYETQAREALKLDLVLTKIAEEKDIKVSESEIDAAIKETVSGKNSFENLNTPERRRLVGSLLRKRRALDSLVSLV